MALAFHRGLRYQSPMNSESIRKILDKLDLVTREEFDVQEAVLARTREKLDALEKQLQAMEGRNEHRDTEEPGADRD